ncbi:MAG TPA: ABC transporter substrate-binding protein [Candidatus Dormibacteraeota bacterium]
MTIVGRTFWSAGVALSVLASSCTNATPTASPIPSSRAQNGASHLALIEAEDAQTLDPALIDDPTSLAIGSEIFEGLTRLDANHRPAPGLASSWDVSNAGKTYVFHLRSAQYQSGNAVQAQDAVTAWTHALAPATNSSNTIFFSALGARYPGDPLTGVTAVDSRTLRLELTQPDSELLTLLALPPFWINDPKQGSAGSGPYHLDRWDRGRGLHLSFFNGYWGARPSVRSVDIEIEPDNVKRLDRFTSGAVDIAHGFTGPQLLAFARDPKQEAELHKVASTRTTWLGFNSIAGSGYGPTDRQAIAAAIDRARLTDLALYGSMLGVPATDLLPPGVPGHIDRPLPLYNPAGAKNALDQASFPGPIDLYFSTNATEGRVANDLQDQIATATGRPVNLHPTGDFFNQAALNKLPFFIDTWSADIPYPADFLENVIRGGSQFNNLALNDVDIERALNQGRAALTWDDAIKAYQQAEAVAISQGWVIPLYHGVEPYLVRTGLKVPFTGGTIAYRWEDVR